MKSLLLLSLLVVSPAFAAWEGVDSSSDGFTPNNGCPYGTWSVPAFDRDDFGDACEKLVDDGCSKQMTIGKAGLGSSQFAGNVDDCDDSAPLSVDQCKNTWYAGVNAVMGHMVGTTCGGFVNAFDADGNTIGVLGATGTCVSTAPPP